MNQASTRALRSAWILYPILLLATLAAWALSSPPGSSPDEDFHLVSAWCAWGPREGLCESGSTATAKAVPRDVAKVACFAFKRDESGSCPLHGNEIVETTRWNYGGLYPDGFFVVMGAFAGPSVEGSVVAMRIFNATMYAGGLAALLLLAPVARRGKYMLASLVTLVPMGLFIVASVNPSSWAVTSATLVWPSAFEFGRSTERRKRIALGILCLFGFALAFASRADAAAYAGLALGLGWFANAKLGRRTLVYGAVVAGIAVVAFLWSQSTRSIFDLLGRPASTPEEPGAWYQRIQDLPNLYAGNLGTRALGWLDTPMQPLTWILAGSAFAVMIFWGLRRCGWRKAISLLVIAVVGAAIPIVIAASKHATLFNSVQSRYFLPLLILAAMIALTQGNDDGPQLHLAQGLLIVGALGLAQADALHTNLRRYVTGLDGKWFNVDAGLQWWWSIGVPSPMVILAVASVSFVGAAAAVVVSQARPELGMSPDLAEAISE